MSDYREMYERAASFRGWDFTKITRRMKTFGERWDFLDLVRQNLKEDLTILDIGTGGGEKLLGLARLVQKAFAIDIQVTMIRTAMRNRKELGVTNVGFLLADSKNLPFALETFDLVICRHAGYYASEVHRVLKPKGTFLTQQVHARRDKLNIKQVFGRGQGLDRPSRDPPRMSVSELKAAGLTILRDDEYDATEFYADMSDLIFLLRNSPTIPDFDIEGDHRHLEEIERRYKTPDGIRTNSARYLIVARKDGN